MDFNHRKLVVEPSLCESLCAKGGPTYCPPSCAVLCPNKCDSSYDPYKIIPPSSAVSSPHNSHKHSTFLTVTIVLLAASFLLICGYVLYMKYYNNSRGTNSSSQADHHHQTRDDEFLDEEHGPTADHPIWYIRTVGLQPSTINSITVLKYKKGDGIVDGTDCSVCLSEFQEDESLRLLPKCSHAFHIPCIDTWLRSHTNCPLCRAPIVINSVIRTSLPERSHVNSSSEEETRMGVLETETENDTETGRDHEEGKRGESSSDEDVMESMSQSSRRSFSLDSPSGFSISPAVSKECDGSFSDKQMELVSKVNSAIGAKRVGGNQKLQRMRSGSSNERSLQSGPVSMKRSVSCNGKFVLCRQVKSSDSVLPLRSI